MYNAVNYFGAIYIPLILSLSIHEFAHAYAAYKLGDDTAKYQDRLSVNPFVHLDFIGTIILPLCGIPFGWAKPVPFNPQRFRQNVSMNLGTAIVALAGPVSNFIIAFLCLIILNLIDQPQSALTTCIVELLQKLFSLNLVLGLFNLIPIPPLDGGHILNYFMPRILRPIWEPIYTSGPYLLLILCLIFSFQLNLIFHRFF